MTAVLYELTTRFMCLTDYPGVVAGSRANNTERQANRAAIQAAIDDCATNKKILYGPASDYQIHGASLIIPANFRWLGTPQTRFIQYSLNIPVIHLGAAAGTANVSCENVVMDGFNLRYSGTATSGGSAFHLTGPRSCKFDNVYIGDIQADYSTRVSVPWIGIEIDSADDTVPGFSNSWGLTRIEHWGFRAISVDRVGYEAATGNIFDNTYLRGGNSSGVQDLSGVAGACAIYMKAQAQACFRLLNVEWMKASIFVDMELCNQTTFDVLNLEGLHLKSATGGASYGFFHMYDGSYTYNAVTVADCHILSANNMSSGFVFWVGPNTCMSYDNLRVRATENTVPFYMIGSHGATNSRVDIGQTILGDDDGLTAFDDGVFAAGEGNGYGLLTDFNGNTPVVLADAAQTAYAWRGKGILRVPTTARRPLTLARTCTAAITAVIPPGVRRTVVNAGTGLLLVSNYDGHLLTTLAANGSADIFFDVDGNWKLLSRSSGAALATSMMPYGLNSHWNEALHYDKWVEAGVNWIRITIPWSEVEATEGAFTWTSIDTALDTAESEGLLVLVVLAYTPAWATSVTGNEKGAPLETKESAWKNYVQTTYDRYKTQVAAWEVWNEPDYEIFFVNGPGTWARNNLTNNEAGRRAQYLRTVNQALSIIGTSLLTTSGWALPAYPSVDNQFLKLINEDVDDLNQNWFRQFPVFSYHCYGYPAYWRLTMMPRYYRNVIESTYEGRSDNWITEHGITPGGDTATEDEIYRYLIRSYALSLGQVRVKKMFWFPGGYATDHAAFLNGSSVRQPAFYAHQELATVHWPSDALASVEPWGFGSLQGAIGTMLDGSRVAIVWNDGPGDATLNSIGFDIDLAYTRYGDLITDLNQNLDGNPVFLHLET